MPRIESDEYVDSLSDPKQRRLPAKKQVLKRQAIARMSKKCPVIISANKSIDAIEESDYSGDIQYVIESLVVELEGMPEAAATVDLLKRLIKFGETS